MKHVKPSKENMVLLILDGHKTHTKNIDLITFARDNGIIMLSLPPHTFHKLQPLNRTFFKPLKSAFNAACTSWMRMHPARRITVDKLGELFIAAYIKAATVENAVNGFRCTGIVPYDRDIIPESEFLNDPRIAEDTGNTSSVLHHQEAKVNKPGTSASRDDSNLALEGFSLSKGDPCSSHTISRMCQ